MENYLKEFNTHSDYETFKASTNFIRPNVSICIAEKDVHYNPKDYSKKYLTFKALEDGTFSFSTNDILYSTDYGTTWTTLTAGTNTSTVSAGSRIMWKASGLTPTSSAGIGTFSSTGKFIAEGNVMSLHFGDNFENLINLTGKNYAFKLLFKNCINLISASKLILPATTLVNSCYYEMFNICTSLTTAPELPATTLTLECYRMMFRNCYNLMMAPALPATTLSNNCYLNMFTKCESLTTAPDLPATTLVNSCYNYMFAGCTSLSKIKCLATDISASNCLTNWVQNVSSIGTFIKAEGMTSWTTGDNGIPTSWDVVQIA